jgi:tripartite-type tricarboxylate transporter receptor subunit TctC
MRAVAAAGRWFLAAAMLLWAASGAFAGNTPPDTEPYPARPIRIIVPASPGGTMDLLTRALGERLESRLGVAVVVDDKPGANGVIANDAARRAQADGYTLLAASTATLVMLPHVVAQLGFDPLRDFVPIVNLVYQTKVVLVSSALGVETLDGLVALARRRPGELNYGSTGIGSSSHLDTAQLAALTGIDIVHIPYRGSPQTVAALSANEVQILLASVTAALPAVASGRARALAVLADRRSPLLPEVPTIVEAGLPSLDVQTWIGFLAPAGTSPAIVDALNQALNRILRSRDTDAWLEKQGLQAVGGSADAFGSVMRADFDKWGEVTRRLGLRPR